MSAVILGLMGGKRRTGTAPPPPPPPPTDPVGSTVALQSGASTTSGFTVSGMTLGGADIRVVASASADLSSPVYSSSVTPDSSGRFKASVTGLPAGIQPYYALELGGGIYTGMVARARTSATGRAPFSIAVSSCDGGSGTSDVYSRIRARNPHMFFSPGDRQYINNTSASQTNYQAAYDRVLKSAGMGPLLRAMPEVYTWSDHDFADNNSVGTSGAGNTVKSFAQAAYRNRHPHHTLPSATGGIYHTFTYNGVRFVVTDTRSYKSSLGAADTSSKTILGTEQKAWFKNLLATCSENYIVWMGDQPWANYSAADDEWPSFNTERTELANFIKGSTVAGSGKFVEYLAGDMHSLGYDDGTNGLGIVSMQCAAIQQSSSIKVNTMSGGIYPTGSGTSVRQYAIVSFSWPTSTTVTRTFTGYDTADTARITNSKTYTVGT